MTYKDDRRREVLVKAQVYRPTQLQHDSDFGQINLASLKVVPTPAECLPVVISSASQHLRDASMRFLSVRS